MFNATFFTYDGVYSGSYGLKIASIKENSAVNETSYITPEIISAKPTQSKKFLFQGLKYSSMPTYAFSIMSEEPIPEPVQDEIMLWIDSRKGFKTLNIHQPDYEMYDYKCIFTITSIIYHSGQCVGYNLQATFDSAYQYGKPTTKTIVGNGTPQDIYLVNKSGNIDEYIYPNIEFMSSDGSISIVNMSDDSARAFSFDGLTPNSTYKVDNERKIIQGDGRNLLSKFSKKWLRLLRGRNHIKVTINGTLKITCPNYTKIKF